MNTPKVAIITSTYNQEELLQKCIISIKEKTDYKNYKIFVIDDSGTGEIGDKIKKEFRGVDVSKNDQNLGYSISNNILIRKTIERYNPDYILHVDDDTEVVQRDWLKKMIEVGESDENIGILGCKIIYPDGSLQWFFSDGKMHFDKTNRKHRDRNDTEVIKDVENVIGACFLIKRKVLDEIGLYDEKFSPAYGEETDFCYRARKKGFKLVYVGTTELIHHGSSSTKTIFNEKIWFIKKRNAIRLEWLNFSLAKILKHSVIHFGSAVINKKPFRRLKLLARAYKENIANLEEIKEKRRERNSWTSNSSKK